MKKLIIVESPTKAKKISSYLGSDYVVVSSVGHIRDLPIPSKVPAAYKATHGKFAVDLENNFEPCYVVYPEKKKVVNEIKTKLKECDVLYLATDEDREGEAIAWHLTQVLNPQVPTHRMVFHEITKDAILKALDNTRSIDMNLVEAQETRRIIDRLFGYELSPILWRKYGPGLSAGRVQSVALRIIVEREIERIKFVKKDYSSLTVSFEKEGEVIVFPSKLVSVNSQSVANGKDFENDGELKAKSSGFLVLTPESVQEIENDLEKLNYQVVKVDKKPYTKNPKPPFTTSSLQIEAGNRLHMSSSQIMSTAQQLYENGYITYMRTDSPTLSTEALSAAKNSAVELYGKSNVEVNGRQFGAKSSNAQEAHEAIRPAGSKWKTPDQVAMELTPSQLALYDLIFRRTVASQMIPATGFRTNVKIEATGKSQYTFSSGGTVIINKGFLNALDDNYSNAADSENEDVENALLPELSENDQLNFIDAFAKSHSTKPPARFSEPALVKKMEELGIGRPSTYASIIKTLLDRGYVFKNGAALTPRWLSFAIIKLLEKDLTKYVDYDFTAKMEVDLDAIASGSADKLSSMNEFYFGDDGLKKNVEEVLTKQKNEEFDEDIFELPQTDYQVHLYRANAYVEKVEKMENKPKGRIPDDLPPDEITEEIANKLVEDSKKADEPLGVNPETGYPIIIKTGKYGPFFTELLPEGVPTKGKGAVKPKMASLLKTWNPQTVTIEDALKVFRLPIKLGVNPSDGQEISVNNGMFGPYFMKKDLESDKIDYRSIKKTDDQTAEERMFEVTLEDAIEIYSQPKVTRARRGGRAFKKK